MLPRPVTCFLSLAIFAGLSCAAWAQGQVKPAQRPKVVKVLRTTDKAQANTYVPKVFEVRHANPYEVSSFVDDAVRTESGLIATYANPEENSNSGMILVVAPAYQLESIGRVIKELDRPRLTNLSGTKYAYVNIKHRSVANTHLAYSDPTVSGQTDFVRSLLLLGGEDTQVHEDVETNSLLVSGAPSGVDAVVSSIVDFDLPREQIEIAVKVYEVEVKNDATLGLDFMAWKNGPGRDLFTVSLHEYNIKDDIDYREVWERGRINQYGTTLEYTSEFFDFLAVKGRARVVNRLRGAVINGFPATFQVFDDILHYPDTEHEYDEEGRRTSRRLADALDRGLVDRQLYEAIFQPGQVVPPQAVATAEPEEAPRLETQATQVGTGLLDRSGIREGLLLQVTPLISRSNIDLNVITSLQTFLSFDGRGVPLVGERDIETRVRAASGEEVILGGIKRERDVRLTRKVPLLGSIPVIGYLFGGDITGRKMVTVFEAITPTILGGQGLSEQDQAVIDRAQGDKRFGVPAGDYGFEQILIDTRP